MPPTLRKLVCLRAAATFAAVSMTVPTFIGVPVSWAAPLEAGRVQESETLQLSSAPITLVAPAGRGQWARKLAGFADAAAQTFTGILGAAPPAGTIRWTPDPLVASETSASVDVTQGSNAVTISFSDPFAILAEDYGVAFAQGYARWITGYAVARLYFSRADDPSAWWIDGAALYMTELLARGERSTTPVLYNLQAAYNRGARTDAGIPLTGEGRAAAGDAARGKSLATFRLLEALYGEAAVTNLLLLAANAPAAEGIRQTAVGNLPADLVPEPRALLDAWLEPRSKLDLALDGVEVVDGGRRIRGRVTRAGDVPVWTQVEVRLADGSLVYADIPAGVETESWELDVSERLAFEIEPFHSIGSVL